MSQSRWIEFALVGSLTGFLAASGGALVHYVFNFTWTFSPLVGLIGMVVGGACTFAGGCVGFRHVLNQLPLQTLREA